MNTLEKILSGLMGVEYDLKALCVVLKALEKHYESNGVEELNALICLVKGQTETFSRQLANSITELDKYLLESK